MGIHKWGIEPLRMYTWIISCWQYQSLSQENTLSLRSRATKGVSWALLEKFGLYAGQFVVSIILARLLTPSDFGLIAMVSIFLVLGQTLINQGFGPALIQMQRADERDRSSVFFLSVITGLCLAATMYLTSPLIAQFYDEPKLVSLTQVMSVSLIIGSLMTTQYSILKKSLNFRAIVISSLLALPVSAFIGIWMALNDYGVWSLVGQALSSKVIRLMSIWIMSHWRPRLEFHPSSIRKLFPFGIKMLISGIITVCFENIYTLIIGRVYNKSSLGLYSRARRIHHLSSVLPTQVLGQVAFPLFSIIQHDIDKLLRALRKAVSISTYAIFPVLAIIWALAGDIVLLLLGSKWLAAAPYIRILCIVGVFYPMKYIIGNAIKALGRSDIILYLNIIYRVLQSTVIAITYRYGVDAMLYGYAIVSGIYYIMHSIIFNKISKYTFTQQGVDIGPNIVLSAIIGILLRLVKIMIPTHDSLLLLPVLILSAVASYVLTSRALEYPAYYEAQSILALYKNRFFKEKPTD